MYVRFFPVEQLVGQRRMVVGEGERRNPDAFVLLFYMHCTTTTHTGKEEEEIKTELLYVEVSPV